MLGSPSPGEQTNVPGGVDIVRPTSDDFQTFLFCVTHLVQLVAKVDGINVVAFQVREHNDLEAIGPPGAIIDSSVSCGPVEETAPVRTTYEKNHCKEKTCCCEHAEEEQPA